MQAIVLAAGKGTRMRSAVPKVLHPILGKALIDYVLETLAGAGIKKPVVVVGSEAGKVRSHVGARARCVLQREQKGTGHAVLAAEKAVGSGERDVLIWPGDMPLIQLSTLKALLHRHRKGGFEASVLSAVKADPSGYGRILRAGGSFYGIREELDATAAQKRIQEVNTGIYVFRRSRLFPVLKRLKPDNKKKEVYLTDTIERLSGKGASIEAFPLTGSREGQGINSREDLALAIKEMNKRHIRRLQQKGVTVVAPEQTFIAADVQIGQDTTIHPWTYIERHVKIGRNCEIGPFAKIRSGTVIRDGSEIGSFVEVTRSRIGRKVFAKHLTYLGDAVIGDETNIGAGTVTANFDGKKKHRTRIGKKVLVGSDTVFVAPVTVADEARTGAGAVVTSGSKVKKGDVVAGVPARSLRHRKERA